MSASLRVPATELRRRLGSRRQVERRIPSDDIRDLGDVAGTVVVGGTDLVLDLTLESVPEGVMVTGTVTAPWSAECRRCLNPVVGAVEVDIHELFEHDPTPGDTYPLDDETVDLEPMLRDAVLLALPLSVLCGDECAGPDPERFPATIEPDESAGDDEEEEPPTGDPRWAALGELRFED